MGKVRKSIKGTASTIFRSRKSKAKEVSKSSKSKKIVDKEPESNSKIDHG